MTYKLEDKTKGRKALKRTLGGLAALVIGAQFDLWVVDDAMELGGIGAMLWYGRESYNYTKNRIREYTPWRKK